MTSVNIANIRALGKALPNALWCVWVKSPRDDGSVGKIPQVVRGGKLVAIGANDPSQWVSYDQALTWLSEGYGDGVGLLVGCSDAENYRSGVVALDVDKCLSDEGSLIDGFNLDLKCGISELQKASVYLEVSPSGKGLRGLYVGELPEGLKQKSNTGGHSVEMYDCRCTRFVTITGGVWKGSPTSPPTLPLEFGSHVAEYLGLLRDEGLNAEGSKYPTRDLDPLSDAEILTRLKQSKKMRAVSEGDLADYDGDGSSADMALCTFIAHYTDDPKQVERVWLSTLLAKRDKTQNRKDYRDRTVIAALNEARKNAAFKSAKESRLNNVLSEADSSGLLTHYSNENGGKIPNSLGGITTVLKLDSRLNGVIAFDNFSGQVVKLRSLRSCLGDVVPADKIDIMQAWSDADTLALTVWLEKVWQVKSQVRFVSEAVDFVAKEFAINSVVDTLESLKWDGKARVKNLYKYFDADTSVDSKELLEQYGVCWMVGAVRRAYQPGVKMDSVLVLEGAQGAQKSTAIRVLCDAIAPWAFAENLPNLNSDEANRFLQGRWICELAELASVDRASVEQVKAYITRCVDTVRPLFGKRYTPIKRTAVFAATVNKFEYIADSEGRRFMSMRVKSEIDLEALRRDAAMLWAEAVVLMKQGVPHWLTEKDIKLEAYRSQKRRLITGGWDEVILTKIVDGYVTSPKASTSPFYEQALTIWGMIGQPETEFNKNAKSFSDALSRCGFVNSKSNGRSMWKMGDELLAQIEARKLGVFI